MKEEIQEDLITDYGLGKRKRQDVNYKEDLSEAQWLKIVDAGGDPAAEIAKRKKIRLENPDAVFSGDE